MRKIHEREAPWETITFPSADGRTEEEDEDGGCTRFHCSAAHPLKINQ